MSPAFRSPSAPSGTRRPTILESSCAALTAPFYWAPHSPGELLELVLGLILSPFAVPAMMLWFTARNGGPIKARTGRSVAAQLADQIWLYVKAGVLPPWYYVYELHRDPVKRAARSFIQRCECKRGVPALLKDIRPPASELTDKVEFARWCRGEENPDGSGACRGA